MQHKKLLYQPTLFYSPSRIVNEKIAAMAPDGHGHGQKRTILAVFLKAQEVCFRQ
jgi:hypothetical protein